MARGDYGPEVKSSMQSPVKRPSQVKKGVPQSPAQEVSNARKPTSPAPGGGPAVGPLPAGPPVGSAGSASGTPPASGIPPHVQAAAGIAHAILANRGM